jgi:hypothetical protein
LLFVGARLGNHSQTMRLSWTYGAYEVIFSRE